MSYLQGEGQQPSGMVLIFIGGWLVRAGGGKAREELPNFAPVFPELVLCRHVTFADRAWVRGASQGLCCLRVAIAHVCFLHFNG